MFGKYLLGWIGGIVGFFGIILALIGIFGDKSYLIMGIAMSVGGGFLRYISSQAVTVENQVSVGNDVQEERIEKNHYSYDGEKELENETYQLYLVEKYDIKKNDTMGKYVLNNKPYLDLKEALKIAHNLETGE